MTQAKSQTVKKLSSTQQIGNGAPSNVTKNLTTGKVTQAKSQTVKPLSSSKSTKTNNSNNTNNRNKGKSK